MQVLDQAVRIQFRGEAPPLPASPYLHGIYRNFVQGAAKVASRYGVPIGTKGDADPHKSNPKFWGERPLPAIGVTYAAADVVLNAALLRAMQREGALHPELHIGVQYHSERYAGWFRDRPRELDRASGVDESFIMQEVAVVDPAAWARAHPGHA